MKLISLIICLFITACSIAPYKVTQIDAAKIKTIAVVSLLGDKMTIQKITTAQQFTGVGQYQKDVKISSWTVDSVIEAALGKELQKSGKKYLPTQVSTSDRTHLINESLKLGNDLTSKVLQLAKSSQAEYAIVISPASVVRKSGVFNGNTEPILLACSSNEILPRLNLMYRFEVWRIKDKVKIAGAPLVIEARYNGDVKCESVSKSSDKKLEESFKPAFVIAAKALADETIKNSGLVK